MTEVVIKNKKLLKQLDQFTDIFFGIDGYDDKKYWVRDPADAVTNGELYCSDEYLKKQMAMGDAHYRVSRTTFLSASRTNGR